ncbi:MAG: hypothetical protein WD801_01715 [Gemmatimonadaceae bacterium]
MPSTPSPGAAPPDAGEEEYRERLARALGADYTLRELIGRGGFGSVYAAWDQRLEREVAVKALRHDLFPTRLVLERFRREAKAVAKLRHPLPLWLRALMTAVAAMKTPFVVAALMVPLAAKIIGGRSGVSTHTVLRLLFTWRADHRNGSDGRRLLVADASSVVKPRAAGNV